MINKNSETILIMKYVQVYQERFMKWYVYREKHCCRKNTPIKWSAVDGAILWRQTGGGPVESG